MKSGTVAFAIFSVITCLNSCTSSPEASRESLFFEGGSSQDTLGIKPKEAARAFVFEGGSSRDTIYLEARQSARIYMLKDPTRKKKP